MLFVRHRERVRGRKATDRAGQLALEHNLLRHRDDELTAVGEPENWA